MTAFASYGAFWIALASMVLMEMNKMISADATKGWLLTTLVAWTIFTFILWIGSFKHSQALIWVFTTLLVLFILLDIGVAQGVPAGQGIMKIAGWEGIFCALTAWYLAAAIIINDSFGKTLLPVGPIPKKA
jgi:succinate-acetate transporter protein